MSSCHKPAIGMKRRQRKLFYMNCLNYKSEEGIFSGGEGTNPFSTQAVIKAILPFSQMTTLEEIRRLSTLTADYEVSLWCWNSVLCSGKFTNSIGTSGVDITFGNVKKAEELAGKDSQLKRLLIYADGFMVVSK